MTADATAPQRKPEGRPEDVDTGFWMWAIALVLMSVGYLVDAVSSPASGPHHSMVVVFSVMFLIVVCSIVVAFLFLMRQGYRWARTLLTGGGLVAIFHSVSSLLSGQRPDAAAVAYAVTAIVGSLLIVGGWYLLHRPDSNGFFTR